MERIERAMIFAAEAHDGQKRKGKNRSYVLHLMEAAVTVSMMTDDEDVIIAALLHDTLEDTNTTAGQILERFGERVAALVGAESEDKREDRPRGETWRIRKEEALQTLKAAPREAKLVALGDKLSNVREMARDHKRIGEAVWDQFNQKDKSQHEWYYRSMLAILAEEFPDTPAVQELESLIHQMFA